MDEAKPPERLVEPTDEEQNRPDGDKERITVPLDLRLDAVVLGIFDCRFEELSTVLVEYLIWQTCLYSSYLFIL